MTLGSFFETSFLDGLGLGSGWFASDENFDVSFASLVNPSVSDGGRERSNILSVCVVEDANILEREFQENHRNGKSRRAGFVAIHVDRELIVHSGWSVLRPLRPATNHTLSAQRDYLREATYKKWTSS